MRQSPMLDYPVSEFKARMDDAARRIKAAGLDCLMGTSKYIVCHLTGLRSVVWKSKLSTPGLLFLGSDGRYGVVNSFTGLEAALYSSCLERSEFFNFDYSGRMGIASNLFDAMCYTIRHFGYEKGRIGCELSTGIHLHMDIGLFDALKREFPEAEFVDSTAIVADILAGKSPMQLDYMRRAEEINRKAVCAGAAAIKPGAMTEMELYKEIAKAGYLAGSEHFTYMSLVSGPERALCLDCPASDAQVISAEPGTIVRVEGGAVSHELNVPFTGNIVVGGVQPGQEAAWELGRAMIAGAMSAVKAGALAGDAAEAIDAAAEALGRAGWAAQPGYAGAGCGWGRIDGPLLRKGSDYVLRDGMTLSLLASVEHASVGLLMLRQNVVVTEDGCEFLNGPTCDPLVV